MLNLQELANISQIAENPCLDQASCLGTALYPPILQFLVFDSVEESNSLPTELRDWQNPDSIGTDFEVE